MKKALICLLVVLAALVAIPTAALAAPGDTGTDPATQLKWLELDDGTVMITGPGLTSGAVTIPDTINDKTVSAIGDYAFSGCASVTSFQIPDSVKSIGERAFDGCFSITSFDFPDSLESIGASAFHNCIRIPSLVLPDSLRTIGYHAFDGCNGISSVQFNDNLQTLEEGAFWYCRGLGSVTLPDSVTSIGYGGFYGCENLRTVRLPALLKVLPDYMFYGCVSLGNVSLPQGLESVGSHAFYGLDGITDVTIPDTVTSIGDQAYAATRYLTKATILSRTLDIQPNMFGVPYGCTFYGLAGSPARTFAVNYLGSNRFHLVCEVYTDPANGEDQTKQYVNAGDELTQPGAPSRTGYTFDYWHANDPDQPWNFDSDTVSQDMTLTAHWTINRYPLTYVLNGGSGDGLEPSDAEYNSLLTKPADPTRTGYTFDAWYKDSGFQEKWDFDSDKVPADEVTLFANWTVNQYTVTIDPNNGSGGDEFKVDYGTPLDEPEVPTRIGYTFDGWYTDGEAPYKWKFDTDTVPAEDITLLAHWTINKYHVTYTTNGGTGSGLEPFDAEYNSLLTKPADPTRTGYTFDAWYRDGGFSVKWNFAQDKVQTEDITLLAHWTINKYHVTYVRNGGTGNGLESFDAEYNALLTKPDDPALEGYTFDAWYKDSEFTAKWDFATDKVPAGDVTLYANWLINQYTLRYNANGGTAVPDRTADFGSLLIKPIDPARTGYTFDAWYKDSKLTIKWDFAKDKMPARDVTLLAKWIIKKYSVKFSTNGGSAVAGRTVDYGSLLTRPSDPARTGYTFGGWYRDTGFKTAWNFASDKVPASDITLFAKWTITVCTVAAAPNNTLYGSVAGAGGYNYGTQATLKAIPKAGYRFVRWLEGSAAVSSGVEYTFTVSGSRTLKAEFAAVGAPALTAAPAGYDSVRLTWGGVAGAVGYEVYRASTVAGVYSKIGLITGTAYLDGGLLTGKTYYYKVRAKCVAGSAVTYGGYSLVRAAAPALAQPTGFAAAPASAGSIKLTWNAVPGATKYEIFRAASYGGNYGKIAETASASFLNTGLLKGATCYYKVRAFRLVGGVKVYGAVSIIVWAKP